MIRLCTKILHSVIIKIQDVAPKVDAPVPRVATLSAAAEHQPLC